MIKVERLSFSFPQKELYTDISFTLEEGQHCAFIGTSGSGKSTLIEILMDPELHADFENTIVAKWFNMIKIAFSLAEQSKIAFHHIPVGVNWKSQFFKVRLIQTAV